MDPQITLVLGGARSGKSRFALSQVPAAGSVFIATALAQDEEMKLRIEKHRQSRPPGWKTQETPYALAETLQTAANRSDSILLVDCLTLWLSNLFCGIGGPALSSAQIESKIEELRKTLPQLKGRILLVSNEVGWGLVPDNPLGREFRDQQGRLNQAIAEVSDNIFLLVAGIAQKIK
ncbi:MAG: bifunctional adenosylcobinamide kinase/adenosylcobinamide-phosphate guanylyltransferase [bacterium]